MNLRLLCLFTAAIAGCTTTESHDLDAEFEEPLETPFAIAPFESRAAEPAPVIESGEVDVLFARGRGDSGAMGCDFDVVEVGLPAISADGRFIAYAETYAPPLSTTNKRTLHVVAVDDESEVETFALYSSEDVDGDECDAAGRTSRGRVRLARQYLAKRSWRPLEYARVQIANFMGDGVEGDLESLRDVPSRERPLQATTVGSQFVLRVLGVAVVHRSSDPSFGGAYLDRVFFDRPTGTGLVLYDVIDDCDCRCNMSTLSAVQRFDDSVIAAFDERRCGENCFVGWADDMMRFEDYEQ